MRAAVLHGTRDLRIEDVPDPEPGPGEVLVRVALNGLCGTDRDEFDHGPTMVPLTTPHPGSGHVGPTVMGHEFIGEVVAAGAGAEQLVGTRVACGAGVSCGSCARCWEGRTNLCDDYYTLGLSTHGGLAELVVAPADTCVRVPDGCADVDAALAQPLAVGLHALDRAEVAAGDTVALVGAGAIGSFVAAGLGERSCHAVALDVAGDRLRSIAELGVDETHLVAPDASATDLTTVLPDGADVVFETSGSPGSAARAAALVRPGGRLVLVGLAGVQELDVTSLVLDEIDLRTTVAHVCSRDLPAALALLRRRPLAEHLVQRVIPLETVVEEGFEALSAGTATGKILVEVNSG